MSDITFYSNPGTNDYKVVMLEEALISWVINKVTMGKNNKKAPKPATEIKAKATSDSDLAMYFQFWK